MDFDLAAKRLDRDHSRLKRDSAARPGRSGRGGGSGGVELSSRARKEAEDRQRRARRVAEEKQARVRERDYQLEVIRTFERSLKVRSLTASTTGGGVGGYLPTSIHGEGDKLALPPSVLEHLTSAMTEIASPWTFRIGILNPEYMFPASPLVRGLKPPPLDDAMEEDDANDSSDDDDDETDRTAQVAAYLDELNHKYLAYTHGTVVEFTQEEGQVGLPRTIASALLEQVDAKSASVRVKRTVDPATRSDAAAEMDVDRDTYMSNNNTSDVDEEKTAGHLAWGAFDVPDMPIEVSLVELPKGTACTLAPTPEAVANGFYNLADVKLVLEQSLIRTRATLTVGDVVHTWNRGVQYDLHVTSVRPGTYNAVVCINTDIEVDFAPAPSSSSSSATDAKPLRHEAPPSGGRTLNESKPQPSSPSTSSTIPAASLSATAASQRRAASLRPEPPADRTDGVCMIQVRFERLSAKRRFDVNEARVMDLYDFVTASAILTDADGRVPPFRLVTRYPRRVIDLPGSAGSDENRILAEAGINAGQELLIVERL